MIDVTRLESIAQQLVARVRDDDPEANLRWLRNELGLDLTAPVSDTERLLFVACVAVPTNRTWRQLTGWVNLPEREEHRRAYRREWARRRRVAAGVASTKSDPGPGVAA